MKCKRVLKDGDHFNIDREREQRRSEWGQLEKTLWNKTGFEIVH